MVASDGLSVTFLKRASPARTETAASTFPRLVEIEGERGIDDSRNSEAKGESETFNTSEREKSGLGDLDSLPSFDLSRLLVGHTVLSSLAALYSNDVPQWNIPLALYGLVTVKSAQVTSEALSTFLLLFGGSVFLDLGRLVFGGGFQFFFFLNFLLKPLSLVTALAQLRQTSDSNPFGNSAGGGGMGDRILNATAGFPPFNHRQQANETVWSAPPQATSGGAGGPPGSYQTRFSLDDDSRDLESGGPPSAAASDPLHQQNSSRSAPPTVQVSNQKSFVAPSKGASKKSLAAEGGGYHTLE
ncbi:hypothetical protein JCM11491_006963 [Sporobolomyces phaffii]